jgi:large subunit ribosomal protein L29
MLLQSLLNKTGLVEVVMLKSSEISKLSAKELTEKVAALKTELFNKKFNKFTTGTEKPHVVKQLKKDIARLLTQKNAKK